MVEVFPQCVEPLGAAAIDRRRSRQAQRVGDARGPILERGAAVVVGDDGGSIVMVPVVTVVCAAVMNILFYVRPSLSLW